MRRDPLDSLRSPDMPRRAFMAAFAGGLLATPFTAEAQQAGKAARIGVLSFGIPEPFREGFRQALLEHGYVEGRNLTIEYRWARGQTERLAGLAAELVRQNVDVIVASATPSIQAAAVATRAIPIVMATAGDALGTGLVSSLARPGGNVTGLSLALIELAGKTVTLLREVVPRVRRIACVVHREDPLHRGFLSEVESSARRIGLHFRSFTLGATIVRLIIEYRLPAVSGLRRFARQEGLSPMPRSSVTSRSARPSTSTRSSRGRALASYPLSNPPSLSSSSTSRPPRPSA